MIENEDEEFKSYVMQLRPVQGMRSRDNKNVMYSQRRGMEEAYAAYEILKHAGKDVKELRSLCQDPPDCEGVIDGVLAGIEHTEIAYGKTISSSEKSGYTHYFEWTKEDFIVELGRLITKKDQATPSKNYEHYYLVIETHEMYIGPQELVDWLESVEFSTVLISEAFVGLSYPSSPRTFKVNLRRR